MATAPATNPFGPFFVVEPRTTHTHTAVLLHGRGSSGPEFAEELADTLLSSGLWAGAAAPGPPPPATETDATAVVRRLLGERLPGWRWVFPSSRRDMWSSAFAEPVPAWFEVHLLGDPALRRDLQAPGIREAVPHLAGLLAGEVERLAGRAQRLVLAGISQGGAVGLLVLLRRLAQGELPLGLFAACSTWLPFAAAVESCLACGADGQVGGADDVAFIRSVIIGNSAVASRPTGPLSATPVFLGHGVDDAYVDVELGRQARDVLVRAGMAVEWREYVGAEQEGHWIQEPDELRDVVEFVKVKCSAKKAA